MNNVAKIFLVYHKEWNLYSSSLFSPIIVSDYTWVKKSNIDYYCDSSLDNISNLNDKFCELTALYWIWKNIMEYDYLGLFHYRRYLDIKEKFSIDFELKTNNLKKFFYYLNKVEKKNINFYKYDIYIPKYSYDFLTVRQQIWNIKSKNFLPIKIFDLAYDILLKNYPEYKESLNKYWKSSKHIYGNMFVMKKEILNKYCEWLFPLLFKINEKINYKILNKEQSRIIGHISERFFGVYLEHNKNLYKIKKCRKISFIKEKNKIKKIFKIIITKIPPIYFILSKFCIYFFWKKYKIK